MTDISQIAKLHKLQDLRFEGCHDLSDVTPVKSLTNLKILLLDYCNKLSDLPKLSGLTKLTNLNLSHDNVHDLSPISHLKNCALDVSYNALNLSNKATAGYITVLEGNGCTVTDMPQK